MNSKKQSFYPLRVLKNSLLLLLVFIVLLAALAMMTLFNPDEQQPNIVHLQNSTPTQTIVSTVTDLLSETDSTSLTETPAPPTPTSIESTESIIESPSVLIIEVEGTTFTLAEDVPVYSENTVLPEEGCDWMGIAGQVFNSNGEPQNGISIIVGGEIGKRDLSEIPLKLVTSNIDSIGEGAFLIYLADKPTASHHTLWVQLIHQPGLPLSPIYYIDTFSDCSRAQITMNFSQIP